MLRSLLSFVLTRRPIVILGLLVFFGAGIAAFIQLNVEAYPNPAPVILEITAQAPGSSAEEMERYYTRPMEVGLATTPGIDNIRSTSFYGLSFVRVTFKYGVDYYFALTQVANNLTQNVSLPNNVQPQIQASSLVGEIFRYQVKGTAAYSLNELRAIQDWNVSRRLLTVPGVVQIVPWGGTTREYHVEVDHGKLEGYGITLPQVINAIGNANSNVGGREVSLGDQSVNIRGVGLIQNIPDINNIVVTQQNNLPIRIADIAKVTEGFVPRLGEAGRDKQNDVVTGVVVMNRTLQTKDVVARVKKEIEQINSDGSLPNGVVIEPYYDRSKLVGVTTHTVLHNLIFGCLLVFFIQWVFLGDLRSAVIVSINIPFALFFSIIILVLTGESANLLSLGAVDFGIIVDSAVILVENIFRNFQFPPAERTRILHQFALSRDASVTDTAPGWSMRLRMIFFSSSQVDSPVLFSTLITIAAFSPLFLMQGVEGQIFGPMARTYGYALAGALLATFSVTPTVSSFLLPRRIVEHETRVVEAIRHFYTPILRWSLDNTRKSLSLGAAAIALAFLLLYVMGGEFLPVLEEGNLWIRASMPPTISLQAGTEKANRMREIINTYPEVLTVVSQHGRPDDGSDASGFNNVELFAPLKPFDEWPSGMTKDKLVKELQDKFSDEFPGVTFNFSQYIQDNVEEGLSGVKGANSVKILGPDLAQLEDLASDIRALMVNIKGVMDLGIFNALGQPNLNIKIDRVKAARYGLNTNDVNTAIQTALGGTVATTVYDSNFNPPRQYTLSVRYRGDQRNNIDRVKNLRVGYTNANGNVSFVPIKDLAEITLDTGATYVYHEGNDRYIPIKFSVRNRDLESTVKDIQSVIAEKITLPEGYRIIYAGEFEELQKAKDRMKILIPIAIGMVMVLLYAQFNNLVYSLLTLAAVPFTVAGGIIGLCLSGQVMSISAVIGFVSLLGVSVMDGMLIMTNSIELLDKGYSQKQATFEACQNRMRPLLMTALSACIGLFPAAISHGIGSQVQRPLATVVVSGMLIGPFFLLVVVPALRLEILTRIQFKRRRKGLGG